MREQFLGHVEGREGNYVLCHAPHAPVFPPPCCGLTEPDPSFPRVSAFFATSSHAAATSAAPRGNEAGISLYQARTGEGLDLSECIDSQAATYASAAPLPRPLPHSRSLMGPVVTTDPNCLWTALHVLLVPDCLGSCQQAMGSRDRVSHSHRPCSYFTYWMTVEIQK